MTDLLLESGVFETFVFCDLSCILRSAFYGDSDSNA